MILKKSVMTVIFCIALVSGVLGSSYSKVYVNSGSNAGPYQYVGYGVPPAAYSAPIAQLSAPPVQSVVPYPQAARFVAPCVSPCVPQQPVAAVANADLIAYAAPRAPVVVAGDVPSNYEYSYVVYDDGTGDQKAARELSDGGVVSGQYSFLQPDGYVREVQYTADDANGFNAVVNYVPGQKIVQVKEAKPCPEVKTEALKQADVSKEELIPESGGKADVPTKQENKSAEAPTEKPAASEESASKVPASQETKEESKSGNKEETSTKKPAKEETSATEEPAKKENNKSEGNKKPDPASEVLPEDNAETAVVKSVEAPQPAPAIVTNALPLGYVSYDQLLKCIQKMQNAEVRTKSPLTYILLPSNSKLC